MKHTIELHPPKEVLRILRESEDFGLEGGQPVRVDRDPVTNEPDLPDPAHFMFGNEIVIPVHNWDLHGSNILMESSNAELVRSASIMGGPTIDVYRKIVSSQPAYFVWLYTEEDPFLICWIEVP